MDRKRYHNINLYAAWATKALLASVLAIFITIPAIGQDIGQQEILANVDITIEENPRAIQQEVQGQVIDAQSEESLPGVNIGVKSTASGTSTDDKGKFSLTVPSLQDTLIFSFVGYQSLEEPINGRTTINVQLQPEDIGLDELVVVGYGVQEKSDLTGSISQANLSDEIQGQSITNVNEALKGRVAGVNITSSSGGPGSSSQVRIRGMNTFGSTGPLYIVDGIPMDQADVDNINPNDIESTSVLKDASAAAIYGSRAANGVIILNTTSGGNRETQVTYSGYYGIQNFTDFIPLLNSQQYADVVNEAHVNGNFYPLQKALDDPEVLETSTNWQDAAMDPAPISNHSLTISGGNEDATYSINAAYTGQESVMAFRNMERYYSKVKTNFDVGDWSFGETIMLSRQKGLNLSYDTNLDFAYMFGASPTMPVYSDENDSGYAGPTPETTGVNNRDNILGRRDMQPDNSYKNSIVGNVYAIYEFMPSLEYRFDASLNYQGNRSKYYSPMFEMGNRGSNSRSLSEGMSEGYQYNIENKLTYDQSINESLDVNLLAGYTRQNYIFNSINGGIQGFPSNEIRVLSAGTGDYSIGGNSAEWALESFLGRANITLFDTYLFTTTFRRDGSSRFGQGNRYGNFPSFALGWRISQEDFMSAIPSINELKLRASWGKLGNQDISNYASRTLVSTNTRYAFGSNNIAPVAAISALGNSQIQWETTTQSNIGIDLSLFEDKVTFIADYWVKNTDGILVRTPISVVSGYERDNGPYQNAAEMRNKGFEFTLGYNSRNTLNKDFSYQFNVNLSTLRNELVALGGGQESIINVMDQAYYVGTYVRNREGKPMSQFYGHIMDGIFQNQSEIDSHADQPGAEPGDIRYRDINDDGIIDANDRTDIGNPWPNFEYGVSANASYKRFDVSLNIHGVQGKDMYDANGAYLEAMQGEWNQKATVLDRWQGEGTSNTMPRAVRGDPNNNQRGSTRWVEDASYLRLQSLQIGYTLPVDVVGRFGVQSLRFYFNGQNLLTLDNYPGYNPSILGASSFHFNVPDPLGFGVDTGSTPLPKVYQLGLRLVF